MTTAAALRRPAAPLLPALALVALVLPGHVRLGWAALSCDSDPRARADPRAETGPPPRPGAAPHTSAQLANPSDYDGARPDATHPDEGLKGSGPRLVIHRKRGDVVERILGNTVAAPGDLIQVSYAAAGNRHGVIVSYDDRGVVTLHHPSAPQDAPRLQARGIATLEHAWELDRAATVERFIFVTAGDEPLEVDRVLYATTVVARHDPSVRSSTAPIPRLDLPVHWHQTTLTLHKQR